MSADLDTGRVIRSWLRRDGPMSADRVLDTVLARLDTTPQRRSRWAAWRIETMNSFARGVGATAAVVVVAVLAIALSSGRGTGTPLSTATAGPGFSHHPKGAAPSPEIDPFNADNSLGWHSKTVDGIPITFDIPAKGWERYGTVYLNKSAFGPQDAEGIIMSAGFPDGVEADPCAGWESPRIFSGSGVVPAGVATRDVALAVSQAPGVDVITQPTEVIVGGRAATFVAVKVREDLLCDPGYFYNWKFQTGGAFWVDTLVGDTIRVWVVNVDGKFLFLEGETHASAPASLIQEIESIVDSIEFD